MGSAVRLEWTPLAIAVVTMMARSEDRRTHEASGKMSSARGRDLVPVPVLVLLAVCLWILVLDRSGGKGGRSWNSHHQTFT